MEAIKQVVSVVSVSLILYGVLMVVLSEGSMKNSFKYMVSIALLASIVLTFKNADFNLETDLNFVQSSEKPEQIDVNSIEKEATERSITQYLSEQIQMLTDNPFSIEVLTDISDEGYISIREIIVFCSSEDAEKISELISRLGLKAVINESDGSLDEYN